jgi:cytochrome P450 family 710 subfamily A protein
MSLLLTGWTIINSLTISVWLSIIFFGLLILYIHEQIVYILKRGSLPGPKLTIPFIGGIIHMILAPYDFWHGQMKYGKLSWNSIIGRFFVMITDSENSRKIFEKCSSDMPLVLHPNASRLLGNDNIAFMNGQIHKSLRIALLPLFTTKALSIYLHIQEKAIRDHMIKWCEISKISKDGLEMRPLIYDLNINTSLSVFVGPYLTDQIRKQFKINYINLTRGFFAAPIYFPGTQLYKGVHAADSIRESLKHIVAQSKQRMSIEGEEPTCLLDFWMVSTLKTINEAKNNNEMTPQHSTDEEIAKITLDFLFAAQDASTSSLTFAIHELCKHPDVLEKVREEQKLLRSNLSTPITTDILTQMKYTWQVMKELLRLRPPATIALHLANKPIKISEDYTAPKGTLIIPSIWSSNRIGYPDPEKFDPERFNSDRMEHIKFDKNFLTFGAGPHSCLGQRYAMNHIILFISLLTDMDFQRANRSNMDQIMYLPTIYPADGCVLNYIQPRH